MRTLLSVIALTGLLVGTVMADTHSVPAMSQGEVRKIDAANQTITLRHGPIANIGMPPMTMVFQVRKPAQLEGLKVGDKVAFVADKHGNQYGVSELKRAD